jgi:agmatinase
MKEVRKIGFEEVMRRIHRRVGNKPVFVSYDIDFVDPPYNRGEITAVLASSIIYEMITLVALKKKGHNYIDDLTNKKHKSRLLSL